MINETVVLHCKKRSALGFHEAWPRKNTKVTPALTKWLGRDSFAITVPNVFTHTQVTNYEERNSGVIVPRAVISLPDKGISIKVDFRMDGLLDIVKHGSIDNGIITTPMMFKFKGSGYRLEAIIKNIEEIEEK